MASAAAFSSSLSLSTSFNENSLSSSCALLAGSQLGASPSPLPGNRNIFKSSVIVSRTLRGIEEAMRIMRERELRSTMKVRKRPPLRRGKVSGCLHVPDHIPKPPYPSTNALPELSLEPQKHDSKGIACMKASCELAARVLDYAGTLVRPSATTREIDKAVHEMIIDAGAYPSLLGYGGFPKSIYTSVNECMCHGIPDSRQLQHGDIITIGVAVFLNGYHGSTSKTFLCGKVNEDAKHLVKVTEECLEKAISVCNNGALIRRIGRRISAHAQKFGYDVVDRFIGHGIGTILHSGPVIFHNSNEFPGRMTEGQTFTIEPIVTMGSIDSVTWDDNWTTLTADGSLAAQFSHTVLITQNGVEVLTRCSSGVYQGMTTPSVSPV